MPQDFDISCQNCGEIIHLDETLAGPVISRIRDERSPVKEKKDKN